MARVRFHNTGASQVPGLIVMEIKDELDGSGPIDPANRRVVVLFNATTEAVEFDHGDFKGAKFELHPVQLVSQDELVKQASYDAQKVEVLDSRADDRGLR